VDTEELEIMKNYVNLFFEKKQKKPTKKPKNTEQPKSKRE
jgi:hypothetical protein